MTANEDTSDCRPATETQTSAKCIGTNERTTVGTAQQRALMVFSASSRFLSLLSFAELTSPSTVLLKTTCRSLLEEVAKLRTFRSTSLQASPSQR